MGLGINLHLEKGHNLTLADCVEMVIDVHNLPSRLKGQIPILLTLQIVIHLFEKIYFSCIAKKQNLSRDHTSVIQGSANAS